MISYTKDPATVVKECRRILKHGGLLGIGIEHIPIKNTSIDIPEKFGSTVRVNYLNTSGNIISLLDSIMSHKILFEYDHCNQEDGDFSTAVVSICK
jgi:ubiquinone/menaquinone biosynthesis C-methylase UbiE